MTGELNIYGVFVPTLAAWMVLAFLASVVVKRLLTALGFYRLVWHRPLVRSRPVRRPSGRRRLARAAPDLLTPPSVAPRSHPDP